MHMTKEQQDYLISKVGKLLTWRTLRVVGIEIGEQHKPGRPSESHKCSQCDAVHYAKGLCLSHYLKARHTKGIKVNEFGQRIGKRGVILCDFEPECEWQYSMKLRTRWPAECSNGKWYCNHHWQELFDKAKVPE